MSKIGAIVQHKCPKCRKGNLFNKTFSAKVNKECSHCGQDLVVELGFYWGALYITYAFNVALIVVVALSLNFGFAVKNPLVYIGVSVPLLIIFQTYFQKISKSILIHIFSPIKYEKEDDN